jgi:DNA-binding HxlR family transcriptional regulator
MTDKFDILIFINKKKPFKATWRDMLQYFVEEAPPHRRISKRTLHLALLELIKEGYVEKSIDQKTLGPVYAITVKGEKVARKKEMERAWIEAVKKATEQTLIKYIETSEEYADYAEKEYDLLFDAYRQILMDTFNLTKEEFELLWRVCLVLRDSFAALSLYEDFYSFLKEKKFKEIKDEDLAFLNDEEKAKLKQIFAKLASAKKL